MFKLLSISCYVCFFILINSFLIFFNKNLFIFYKFTGLSPGNSVILQSKEDISSQVSLGSRTIESEGSNEFQKILPKVNDMMESRKPMAVSCLKII